jgi:hypothetical protein
MKKYRGLVINIAIEMLMLLFMYYCANPIKPASGRAMIFLIGQLVTLVQIMISFLNDVER